MNNNRNPYHHGTGSHESNTPPRKNAGKLPDGAGAWAAANGDTVDLNVHENPRGHRSKTETQRVHAIAEQSSPAAGEPHMAQGSSSKTDESAADDEMEITFKMMIHLHGEENSPRRVGYLDTGSGTDLIAVQVVEDLGLHMEKYQGVRLLPMGGEFMPEWQVTFDWHISKFENKTYRTTFAVMDREHSDGFDVLLGLSTIHKIGFFKKTKQVWMLRTHDREIPAQELSEKVAPG
ncbi:MAG: hypothetical protein Q9207_003471 [Kuettlingeria erythrocarpa]